jgi:hypothetical protein
MLSKNGTVNYAQGVELMDVEIEDKHKEDIKKWFKKNKIRVHTDEIEIEKTEYLNSYNVYIHRKNGILRHFIGRFAFSRQGLKTGTSLSEVAQILEYVKEETNIADSYSGIIDILAEFAQKFRTEDIETGILYKVVFSIFQEAPWFSFDFISSIKFSRLAENEYAVRLSELKEIKLSFGSTVHSKEEDTIRLMAKAIALFKGQVEVKETEVRKAFTVYEALLEVFLQRTNLELVTGLVRPEQIAPASEEIGIFKHYIIISSIPAEDLSTRWVLNKIASMAVLFRSIEMLNAEIAKALTTKDPQLISEISKHFKIG